MPLDPEMADCVRYTPSSLPDVTARREALATFFATQVAATDAPIGMTILGVEIANPAGTHRIGLRVYRPQGDGLAPVLLYFHGGGFTAGNLDTEHQWCAELAADVGCIVVSVDYRLAPDHPFPAAFYDAYSALLWVASHCTVWNGDPQRIAIAGTSAGGALAAGVAQASRDRGGPSISFLSLSSPVLDDRLETPSARNFTDVPIFARFQAEQMWRDYLGDRGQEAARYAAPARLDVTGMPPTFILAAGLDPLRDEAVIFAQRLMEAGVATELHVIPSVPHAFNLAKPAARQSVAAATAIKTALQNALRSG